jgi:origin recognition complex subunit 5
MNRQYAYVNCISCYSARVLFETVLNQLSGFIPSATNTKQGFAKCDGLAEFVDIIDSDKVCNNDRTIYLVSFLFCYINTIKILDKAERLRGLGSTLLPGLLRINEFIQKRICVILLSSIIWEKFRDGTGGCDPIPIHFPVYTEGNRFHNEVPNSMTEESIEIITQSRPEEEDEAFYYAFVKLIHNVFHDVSTRKFNACCHLVTTFCFATACIKSLYNTLTTKISRNLIELRYVVNSLYPIYKEPIIKGERTLEDDVF